LLRSDHLGVYGTTSILVRVFCVYVETLSRFVRRFIAEGVCDPKTVDLVVRNTIGLRLATLGPLENADYIGLDLTLAIHDAVIPSLNHDPHPSPLLRELVAAGQLGARTGHGFLDWPAGAREATTARLAQHIAAQLQANEKGRGT
ncbi:3-hydroxyacyl-CoA dehydrogenase family protein, partial [Mycobacterium tuberculosis]